MARSRIGLMGGSFNPIHRRHLQIAARALEEIKLDRVLFIPNGNPPHKQLELADAAHRFEMTRLAVILQKKLKVSDIEITRSGVIYTVDTLKLLRREYPEAEFVYLIGEDTLLDLPHWRQPLEVFTLCSFAVCRRSSQNLELSPAVAELRAMGAKIQFLSLAPEEISATDIRRRIRNGENVDALIPPEVYEYILLEGLYGCPPLPGTDRQTYERLRDSLSDVRLVHSLAVARTARHLADVHGLPADACELAGLLHDCAKCLDLGTLQQLAREHHLNLSQVEMRSNGLLHGPVGAVLAREAYGIGDPAVLTAIASHTTGYVGMTDFDMAVFLADKIEPYRDYLPGLDEISDLAETDLYKATLQMMLHSKEHLLKIGRPLHPETDNIIQWMRNRIR